MKALLAALLALAPTLAQASTTITIQVADPAGSGFNDATPVAPLSTNAGTTRGAQRLNLFQFAAARWAERLHSSVPIVVSASWQGFSAGQCTSTSAILGHAGAAGAFFGFPGAPQPNTLYPAALADALAGADNDPGQPDIEAAFNPNLDSDPNCLGGRGWYYGTDHLPGTKVDLLNVLMHELGHGLGFTSFVNQDGSLLLPGTFGIFDRFLFDESSDQSWTQMNDAQRAASIVNTGNLVWNGASVDRGGQVLTTGRNADHGHVRMFAPNPYQGGSSVAHWDSVASPDLLMEPSYSSSLRASLKVDLTSCLFRDLGWTIDAPFGCPDTLSDLGIAIAGPAGSIGPGTQSSYTLTVTNHGGDRASNVTVDASLSGVAASVSSVGSSQGGCGALPCNLGLLDNGSSATVTLGITPTANGTLTVTGDVFADEHDTVAGNDSASIATSVSANDTTPDAFHFTDRTGVATGTSFISNSITVAGINQPAAISISGAASRAYSINGGAFTSGAGTVVEGDSVRLRVSSAAAASTTVNATLSIGGVSDQWSVATGTIDSTPDAFHFIDRAGLATGTNASSNTITVAGINTAVSISLPTGPASRKFSINGGAFIAGPATVVAGDTVKLQTKTPVSADTTFNINASIGGVSDQWSVATGAVDTTPDPFDFPDVTGATAGATVTTGAVVPTGFNAAVPVSVGGTATRSYAVNGGAFTSADGTLNPGDSVQLRMTAASTAGRTQSITVHIGGLKNTWTVTTAP